MRVKKGMIPFVILVVICGVWSSGIGGTDGEISVNSTSSEVLRYIRAANGDKMSVAVDQMQKVARLTTGISVQLGLISGSIPADPLISELLRLGSVTPSDIVALDAVKLTEAMDQMRELPNALVENKGIEKIGEKLVKIEEVRKMVGKIGGVTTWVGKGEFVKDVEFVEQKLDLEKIRTASKRVNGWFTYKDEVSMIKKVDKKNIADSNDSVKKLKEKIEQIEQSNAELADLNQKGWNYPTMKTAVDGLATLKSLEKTVKKAFDYLVSVGTPIADEENAFTANENNIRQLSTLSGYLNGVFADLQKVENIVRSRGLAGNKGLDFPGFLNGFQDIDELFDDLNDEWMAKVVKVDSMTASLKPLKSLLRFFKKINNVFGSYGSEKTDTFSKFLVHVKSIKEVPPDATQITTAIDGFWKCKELFAKLDNVKGDKLKLFFDTAVELDKKMGELHKSIEAFKSILNSENTVRLMGEVKKLCKTSDDVAVLDPVIKKLKSSKELAELEKVLKTVQKAWSSVETASDQAQKAAGNIMKAVKDVDSYTSSLNNYETLFKCLHGLDDQKSTLVVQGMDISRKFTKTTENDQMVNDGEGVVNNVVGSIEWFGNLKTAIGNMKNQKGEALEALKALSDPAKNSKDIGAAVQGVSAMKGALEKKPQGQLIIDNSAVVGAQLNSVQLAKTDMDNLNAVVQLKGALATMYQKLEDWKNGVTGDSSKVLADYHNLFSTAKVVPGVIGNLGAMANSMDALIKAVTDNSVKKKLVSVKKALKTMDTIGLDFASYSTQLDTSKDTLAALDLFFAGYSAQMTPTVPPPAKSPPKCSSPSTSSALVAQADQLQKKRKCVCEKCEEPWDTERFVGILLSGSSASIFVVTLIVLIWFGIKVECYVKETKSEDKNATTTKAKPKKEEKTAETKSADSRSRSRSQKIIEQV